MVALDEVEVGECSGPNSHNNFYVKGTYMYKLVDPNVSKILFEATLV